MRRELTKRTIGPDEVLAIVHGGTSSSTDPEAVEQFNALTIPELNAINGVIAKETDGSINKNHIPNEIYVANPHHLGDKYLSVVVGTSNQFLITDYNSWATYAISAKYGTVDVITSLDALTGNITFTAPNTIGTVKLSVNEKVYNIAVVPDHPATPVINSPINNSTDRPRTNTASATQFGMVGSGTDVQTGTDWEVATDVDFTNVIVSSYNDTVNKNTFTFTVPNLSTKYYIRVRYKGQTSGLTAWSPVVGFTTRALTLPSNEVAILTPTTPTVSGRFGNSVFINDSGSKLAIGAPFADANGAAGTENSGAVFVFSSSVSGYVEETKIRNLGSLTKVTPTIPTGGYIEVYDGTSLVKTLGPSDSGTLVNLATPTSNLITLKGKGSGGSSVRNPMYLRFYAGSRWVTDGYPNYTPLYQEHAYYSVPFDPVVGFPQSVTGNFTWPSTGDSAGTYTFTLVAGTESNGGSAGYSATYTYAGGSVVVSTGQITYTNTNGIQSSIKVGNGYTESTYTFPGGIASAAVVQNIVLNMGYGEYLGHEVLMSGDSSEIIAAKLSTPNPTGPGQTGYSYGSVDVIKKVGSNWIPNITGTNNITKTEYGFSIAMDSSGTVMAVGNPGLTGEVNIYVKVGYDWVYQNKITFPGRSYFGRTLAMSGSGEYLAIQNFNTTSSIPATISVYKRNGNVYSLVNELTTQVSTEANTFGNSMTFDQLGDRLVVGSAGKELLVSIDASNNDPTSAPPTALIINTNSSGNGNVYVFKKIVSGIFSNEVTIASPVVGDTSFGRSVSINADGDIIAIGAPNASTLVNGITSLEGVVYIQHRDLITNAWTLDKVLTPSVQLPYLVWQNDFEFGGSVHLNQSGAILAVGAPGYRANASQTLTTGAVFIFA